MCNPLESPWAGVGSRRRGTLVNSAVGQGGHSGSREGGRLISRQQLKQLLSEGEGRGYVSQQGTVSAQ